MMLGLGTEATNLRSLPGYQECEQSCLQLGERAGPVSWEEGPPSPTAADLCLAQCAETALAQRKCAWYEEANPDYTPGLAYPGVAPIPSSGRACRISKLIFVGLALAAGLVGWKVLS
jgi:hypothetical protein